MITNGAASPSRHRAALTLSLVPGRSGVDVEQSALALRGVTMEWQDALDLYCAWMIAADTADATLRIYLHDMSRLAVGVCPLAPFEVSLDALVTFLAVRSWAPSTRKTARSAVRSFYRWAFETGRMDEDPSARLRPIRVPAWAA